MSNKIKVPKYLNKKLADATARLRYHVEALNGFMKANELLIRSFDEYDKLGDVYKNNGGENLDEYLEKVKWMKDMFYKHIILNGLGGKNIKKPTNSAEFLEAFDIACKQALGEDVYNAIRESNQDFWKDNKHPKIVKEILNVAKVHDNVESYYVRYLDIVIAGQGELGMPIGFDKFRKNLYSEDEVFKESVNSLGHRVNKRAKDEYKEAYLQAQEAIKSVPEIVENLGGNL